MAFDYEKCYVHNANLTLKENHKTKYCDEECKRCLAEIRKTYNTWRKANEALKGPFAKARPEDTGILRKRVGLFSEYKEFIDEQKYAEMFDSRSNLHSTVLEEFMFYLFRDMVREFSNSALIGKAKTFKDMFFLPPSYAEMVEAPRAVIEQKDHDFVIGVNIRTRMSCDGGKKEEENLLQIPAVAIECKTYLDKAMLEGCSAAAEQLKTRNPNAIYLVVMEWLKLTESINLQKYKVDQIYVLRKQKNTDREFRYAADYVKKPIHLDVVEHLFETVRRHLTGSWLGGVRFGLERGYLL